MRRRPSDGLAGGEHHGGGGGGGGRPGGDASEPGVFVKKIGSRLLTAILFRRLFIISYGLSENIWIATINRDPIREHFIKVRRLYINIRITTINRDPN
jgi:hypothetical protein